MNQIVLSEAEITGQRRWHTDTYRDDPAYVRVAGSKANLLYRFPFWGFLGVDLVLVEAAPFVINTAATDGYHIYYSAEFINSLTDAEVIFVLAHEIEHCVGGHTRGLGLLNRQGDRTAMVMTPDGQRISLWNIACDHRINNDLVTSQIGTMPKSAICDRKYLSRDWSEERIYDDLLENTNGSYKGVPLGKHVVFDPDTTGVEHGDDEIWVKAEPGQIEHEAARWQSIAKQAIAHADNHGDPSKNAGAVPAHLRRLIENMGAPKVNWRGVLRRFVSSFTRTGYSYMMPDKKTFSTGVSIPGFRRRDVRLEVAVAFDTSGSVGVDQLGAFAGEFLHMMGSFPAYSIHAFCFEGTVDPTTYMKVTKTTKSPKEDFKKYAERIKGGGGTRFQSVWDFLRERRIRPKGLIVFTDGYPNDKSWHREKRYCPTMFLTVGNQNNWKAPFGVTVQYEKV